MGPDVTLEKQRQGFYVLSNWQIFSLKLQQVFIMRKYYFHVIYFNPRSLPFATKLHIK
jgi:hypothetical protein